MHAVPLRAPRTFYVDCEPGSEAPALALGGVAVKRTLPGGRQARGTFQITMEEAQFQARALELQAALAAPGILGVYEDRLPLDFEVALRLGCVAAVTPSARRRNLGDGFALHELQARTAAQCRYLPTDAGSLRHMLLHHSGDTARGRGLFALHVPADGAFRVWIVNPAVRGQREVTQAAMDRALREAIEGVRANLLDGEEQRSAELVPDAPATAEVTYVRSLEAAHRAVQRALAAVKDRARLPTLLLVNAAEPALLQHALPALTDMPWAPMPPSASGVQPYPALGWQMPAARAAAYGAAVAGPWLEQRANAAAYAHLPLASVPEDWEVGACDALFARQLRDAGHLLWTADARRAGLADRPVDLAEESALREQRRRPEVTFPGVYRSVCVEIKVDNLAVAAVTEVGIGALHCKSSNKGGKPL
jgi:DNA polymerase epsilon subunit 1